MTPEDLVELEEIKRLKYRYARFLDQKDWEGVATCFVEDATAAYGGKKGKLEGRDAIMEFLRGALKATTRITTHSMGHPEIELTGPDSATGTWSLHDEVIDTELGFVVRGASVYSDEYARSDGEWRIKHTGYKRIYEELTKRPDHARMTASWFETGGESQLVP